GGSGLKCPFPTPKSRHSTEGRFSSPALLHYNRSTLSFRPTSALVTNTYSPKAWRKNGACHLRSRAFEYRLISPHLCQIRQTPHRRRRPCPTPPPPLPLAQPYRLLQMGVLLELPAHTSHPCVILISA